jgi:hypothetical protein
MWQTKIGDYWLSSRFPICATFFYVAAKRSGVYTEEEAKSLSVAKATQYAGLKNRSGAGGPKAAKAKARILFGQPQIKEEDRIVFFSSPELPVVRNNDGELRGMFSDKIFQPEHYDRSVVNRCDVQVKGGYLWLVDQVNTILSKYTQEEIKRLNVFDIYKKWRDELREKKAITLSKAA